MTNYSFNGYEKEKHARALGKDLSISTKDAVEITAFLRKRSLAKSKEILANVAEEKQAIPYKRFTNGLGHRKGEMASGRYPIKAASLLLDLLNSVEANAENKGLNKEKLTIIHMNAHKASRPMHYGRHGGREMKRTHVEVVVGEQQ